MWLLVGLLITLLVLLVCYDIRTMMRNETQERITELRSMGCICDMTYWSLSGEQNCPVHGDWK